MLHLHSLQDMKLFWTAHHTNGTADASASLEGEFDEWFEEWVASDDRPADPDIWW